MQRNCIISRIFHSLHSFFSAAMNIIPAPCRRSFLFPEDAFLCVSCREACLFFAEYFHHSGHEFQLMAHTSRQWKSLTVEKQISARKEFRSKDRFQFFVWIFYLPAQGTSVKNMRVCNKRFFLRCCNLVFAITYQDHSQHKLASCCSKKIKSH